VVSLSPRLLVSPIAGFRSRARSCRRRARLAQRIVRWISTSRARWNVVASIGGFATGRFTTPEEVATLIVLLASDRLGNVTGSNYIIDGGLIKTT
jgi:NAD(P)-dependent dehydrogenase (short-subunit alcohol dehydrogenase family)